MAFLTAFSSFTSIIKFIPVALGAGALVYGYLYIENKNLTIEDLKSDLKTAMEQNGALAKLAEDNRATIENLLEQQHEQNKNISRLEKTNQDITSTNRRYLQIFQRNDFQKLFLARPTLVGDRMVKATNSLFDELETLTEEFKDPAQNEKDTDTVTDNK